MNRSLWTRHAILLALTCGAATSTQAITAGRIIAAVGDVSVVRAGATIRLERNAALESGDMIQTGASSNAQLRMTDGAIVALRPETQFVIEAYQFQGTIASAQEDKGFFALLKGGLRTVTGLIGKANQNGYAMRTTTATIGIRGTDFNLVICEACVNPDGTRARDGLYGGVTDGTIVMKNEAQERAFGKNDVFFVANSRSASEQLIAPPAFLRDRLDGQSRSRQGNQQSQQTQQARTEGQQSGQQQGTSNAQTSGQPGTTAPPPPDGAPPPPPTPPLVQFNQNLNQSGLPAIITTTTGGTPVAGFAGQGDGVFPQAGISARFLFAEWDGGGGFNAHDSQPTNQISVDAQGISSMWGSFNRNTAKVFEGGADGGVVAWGRWADGTMQWAGYGNLTFTADQGNHTIYGIVPTTAPALNSVQFGLIGATRPTETTHAISGNTWSVSGGSLTVNFLSQTFSGNLGLALASAQGNSTYALNFANAGTLAFNSITSLSGNVTQTGGVQNVCGAGCAATGTLLFAGPTTTHAGAAYQFPTNGGVTVQGVAVFKR